MRRHDGMLAKEGKVKRLLLGLSMVASTALAADPVKAALPQQKVLSSPNGRYVFGQVSDYRQDQYMLDTQTGSLWKVVLHKPKNSDGSERPGNGFEVLDVVPYINIDGKITIAPK
jgi:hypothetical protein